MLYHAGYFLQVLEGPDENVEAIYAKVQKDSRHTNCLLLVRETIEERAFEHWSMGFVDTTRIAEKISGFVDYMKALESMALDRTRARIVLTRFQEGIYVALPTGKPCAIALRIMSWRGALHTFRQAPIGRESSSE